MAGSAAVVAIYQASQSIYDVHEPDHPTHISTNRRQVFDKVVVLYEGRQIYFGYANAAKAFFVNLGFHCPDRATTGDFLTSLTNPAERLVREGYENRVPRTPDEFHEVWKKSQDRAQLLRDIEAFKREFPVGGEHLEKFIQSRVAQQAKRQ